MRCHTYQVQVLVTLICFSSCKNNDIENIASFRSLVETMNESNKVVFQSTRTQSYELKEKTNYSSTKEKANFYFLKTEKISRLTTSMIDMLDSTKTLLLENAGIDADEITDSEKWANKNVVNKLFVSQGKGIELQKLFQNYYEDVLSDVESLAKQFRGNLILTSSAFEKQSGIDFASYFFKNTTVAAAYCTLTKFQSNIRTIENKTIEYLCLQVGSVDNWMNYNSYSAIISQNSSNLLPGDSIQILAGVGAFSRAALQKISINGVKAETDESGVAIKKIKVSQKPGKYFIRVAINLLDYNGLPQLIERNIEYTVFDKKSSQ